MTVYYNPDEPELELQEEEDDNNQPALFDEYNEDFYTTEWKGMPEYIQKNFMPWKTVYVHFENKEDLEAFAKLVEQNVYDTTKYIWFPKIESIKPSDYAYE